MAALDVAVAAVAAVAVRAGVVAVGSGPLAEVAVGFTAPDVAEVAVSVRSLACKFSSFS